MSWYIAHSAKGSEWEDKKYVKREGTSGKMEETGKYYYPDDYKGGRHLPKGEKATTKKANSDKKNKRDFGNGDRSTMEDWEKKVHEHLDKIIADYPDLFKSGADVARGIMNENNFSAVKNTLKAFGVNVDKMSDDEIKRLRSKISSYYDKEVTESGGKSSKKSSNKKTDKNKKEDDKKKINKKKKHETVNKNSKKSKFFGHSAVVYVDEDFLEHHGILGMHWGKRNGPPYPLGPSDHSASEKKAGWRKSLSGIFKKKDKPASTSGEISKSGASQPSEPAPKSVKDMTDEELNRALNRLRNEKSYNDLLKGDSGNKQNNDNQSNDKNSYDMTWSKNMSDKEAQDYINRLNNEKRYEELSQRDITQGSRFAKRLLVTAGTVAATTFVTTVGVKAGQAAANKIIEKVAKSKGTSK